MLSTLRWNCRKKLFPFGGDIPLKKNYIRIDRKELFSVIGVAWTEGIGDSRAGYGSVRALLCVTGLEDTCPRPDPALHTRAKLLVVFEWRFCVWRTLALGREHPVPGSKSCSQCCSSFSQVFQLPRHKEWSSPALPRQGINRPVGR